MDEEVGTVRALRHDQQIDMLLAELAAGAVRAVEGLGETGIDHLVGRTQAVGDGLHVPCDLFAQPFIHPPVLEVATGEESDLERTVSESLAEQVAARGASASLERLDLSHDSSFSLPPGRFPLTRRRGRRYHTRNPGAIDFTAFAEAQAT